MNTEYWKINNYGCCSCFIVSSCGKLVLPALINLHIKPGADYQGSENPEVKLSQPQEAACTGCCGQRDAAPDSQGFAHSIRSVMRMDTFVPRQKEGHHPPYTELRGAGREYRYARQSECKQAIPRNRERRHSAAKCSVRIRTRTAGFWFLTCKKECSMV